MKFVGTLFFYIFWSETLGMSSNSGQCNNSMFDGLIKYLKEDSTLHQVLFILDESQNSTDPIMNSLITTVTSHFPSIVTSYNSDENNEPLNESYKKLLIEPRRTTLFVYQLKDPDFMYGFIHFNIKRIDRIETSMHPRIIFVNSLPISQDDINERFDMFWNDLYLDVSFLNYNIRRLEKGIERGFPVLPTLHQMNPFFKNYTYEVLSSESEWFPNKLRDMNGYRINVAIQPVNDSSQEEFNRGIKFLNILQQVMNFQPNLVELYSETGKVMSALDPYHFNLSEYKLYAEENLLEPLIFLNIRKIWENYERGQCHSRPIKLTHAKAVIPNEVKDGRKLEISSEFWYMLSATIGIISFVRLMAYLLKFRKSTWQTFNISQIIMGAASSNEPDNLPERIMFGSLLIGCIVYTGYFYSVILDISFQYSSKISSFDELVKSHLAPVVQSDVSNSIFFTSTSPFVQRWLRKKTIFTQGYELDCLENLEKYRNISCLLDDAEHHVHTYQVKHGLIDVKILKKPINTGFHVFQLQFFSPYAERINAIILKTSEFGLLSDFYGNFQKLQSSPQEPEYITKEKLLPVLVCVLIGGYSLATIAFLLEVITAKLSSFFYKRKVHVEI